MDTSCFLVKKQAEIAPVDVHFLATEKAVRQFLRHPG
jgi:hypothetical protein